MGVKEKYEEQLILLGKAVTDFKLSLDADMEKYDELEQNWIKNAQLQKFEFCIGLLWKTVKSFFEIQSEFFLTPKQNIKELFLHNLIEEELYLGLMSCIEDRNKLSHVYKLEMFEEISSSMYVHYNSILLAQNCLTKSR